jgi:hypothetical protein
LWTEIGAEKFQRNKSLWNPPDRSDDDQLLDESFVDDLTRFLEEKIKELPISFLRLTNVCKTKNGVRKHKDLSSSRNEWSREHELLLVEAVKEKSETEVLHIWQAIYDDKKYKALKTRCKPLDSRQVNRDKYKLLVPKDSSLPDLQLLKVVARMKLKKKQTKMKIRAAHDRRRAMKEAISAASVSDDDDDDSLNDDEDDYDDDEGEDDEEAG